MDAKTGKPELTNLSRLISYSVNSIAYKKYEDIKQTEFI